MISSIHLCQQDNSLNSIEPLCILLEKLSVTLLSIEIASCNGLHKKLVSKAKASPVCGWMMDESTSRSNAKSSIVYVRYVEDNEARTSYYGLIDFQGNGTAKNIVNTLTDLWTKDSTSIISNVVFCEFSAENR
ncbi:unnamed protein product [Adineta steineri]|uniref:Uncharacterized protein n=1 Tax=Adineta steineri TaxID=433720 RepID=A0A819M1U0_9BILA|nr:unnamed protein product [Adineta steineri]CAF3972459.1 unnamed protein product [Adineta steineri]